MNTHLTDAIIKRLDPPAKGNRITFDNDVAGFGIRVTAGVLDPSFSTTERELAGNGGSPSGGSPTGRRLRPG